MNKETLDRVARELALKGYVPAQVDNFIKALKVKSISDEKVDEILKMVKVREPEGDAEDHSMLSTHENLTVEDVVTWVNQSEIASIQNVTLGIINIINDPEATVKDLKELIEVDPPLTAKVLRLANSAEFSSRTQFHDIERAVMWIGFENLKAIALNQKVCEIFQSSRVTLGYSRITLWKHCVAVALLAKMITRREFGEAGENVYAAGLLHDIGILCEDQFMFEDFKNILEQTNKKNKSLQAMERNLWGFDHAIIGSAVCECWELPPDLFVSIGGHHDPLNVPLEHQRLATILFVADYVCHEVGLGNNINYIPDKTTFNNCLIGLDLKASAIHFIAKDMKDEIKKMEENGLFTV